MQEKLMINLAKANAAKKSGYKHKTPIDHWREDPESLRKSINAKCYDCCHGATDEVKHCTVTACPLWFVRPYQEKTNG